MTKVSKYFMNNLHYFLNQTVLGSTHFGLLIRPNVVLRAGFGIAGMTTNFNIMQPRIKRYQWYRIQLPPTGSFKCTLETKDSFTSEVSLCSNGLSGISEWLYHYATSTTITFTQLRAELRPTGCLAAELWRKGSLSTPGCGENECLLICSVTSLTQQCRCEELSVVMGGMKANVKSITGFIQSIVALNNVSLFTQPTSCCARRQAHKWLIGTFTMVGVASAVMWSEASRNTGCQRNHCT